MSALTNQFISDAYVSELHVGLSAIAPTGVQQVWDGAGNRSSISIGREDAGATITGSLTSGNLVFPEVNDPTPLIDFIYPVGSVIFSTESTSPSARFDGTSWEQISEGRFIVGVGEGSDTNGVTKTMPVGPTEGEYVHTLTESELAEHTHVIKTLKVSIADDNAGATGYLGSSPRALQNSGVTPNPSLQNLTTGNSTPHNITPPGYGMYVWKRIN